MYTVYIAVSGRINYDLLFMSFFYNLKKNLKPHKLTVHHKEKIYFIKRKLNNML